MASTWQLLGEYDLDPTSQVTVSNQDEFGNDIGQVCADAVRFEPVHDTAQVLPGHSERYFVLNPELYEQALWARSYATPTTLRSGDYELSLAADENPRPA